MKSSSEAAKLFLPIPDLMLTTIPSIGLLQMRNLRLTEIKSLAHNHKVYKYLSQDLNQIIQLQLWPRFLNPSAI